jgi:hypothetical protein
MGGATEDPAFQQPPIATDYLTMKQDHVATEHREVATEETTTSVHAALLSRLDPRASVDGATRSINRARRSPPEVRRDRDGGRLRGTRSYRGKTARWGSGR